MHFEGSSVGFLHADSPTQYTGTSRRPFAAALVLLLAFAISVAVLVAAAMTTSSEDAYANIYPANESAQVESDQAASGDAAATGGEADGEEAGGESIDEEVAERDEVEEIAEEENPLSSGLGGGEPLSAAGGFGFAPFAIAGIAAVALFFAVRMHRLNGNIHDMKNMFR